MHALSRDEQAGRWFALRLIGAAVTRRVVMLAGLAFVLLLARVPAGQARARRLSDYVNTLRGTDSTPAYSHGNTFPAVTLPFGFNFWTPVTQAKDNGWLYNYAARTIAGFSASHQPSPWIGDYASLQIMPSMGPLSVDPKARAQAFRHVDEIAHAHYYSVVFSDSGIRTEITPTVHGAVFRFTFPRAGSANLLFDTLDAASGAMTLDAQAAAISGYVDYRAPRLYFFATLDTPIASKVDPDGGGANLAIVFPVRAEQAATLRIATSYISVEQARANWLQEIGEKSFDEVRDAAQATWDALLGRVEVEGASDSQKTVLYSNLYRAFMYPNTMSEEVDGTERHFSPYVGAVRDGPLYVNNGFWDTYRAAWPLYVLLLPQQAGDMLDGFVTAYKEGGWIPRWSGPGYIDIMVGTNSDAVLSDAYQKGIRGFDAQAAYASMLKNALVYSSAGAKGRKGNGRAIFRGFVALNDAAESASWTLEDAVNDFAIANMAQALGDKLHAAYFRARSLGYAHLFSSTTGFFRGRRADGTFRTSDADFHPNEWGNEYTEGCAWHYVAAASHDPRGMANLYGGPEAFGAKLDAVLTASPDFSKGSYPNIIHEMREAYDSGRAGFGQYAHPNEPVHHLLYMYDYAGQPWKTQQYVRRVMSDQAPFYGDGIGTGGGYLGDEDDGEMSAWFVFSALGLYPASPGHAQYAIGSPLYSRMTLHLEGGRDFSVVAIDNGSSNPYIQSARFNGAPYERSYLSHREVAAGGELELQMGPQPSKWGSRPQDRPSSLTRTPDVPTPMIDCAQGGVASASSDNAAAGEGVVAAFDDDSGTKWLSFSSNARVQYALSRPCAVTWYTLTSGNDFPERDPADWQLEGSNNGRDWEVLDTRRDQDFQWRRQTAVFDLKKRGSYSYYRLTIARNHAGSITQLAEIELLDDHGAAAATSDQAGARVPDSWSSGSCGSGTFELWAAALGLTALLVWVRRSMRHR